MIWSSPLFFWPRRRTVGFRTSITEGLSASQERLSLREDPQMTPIHRSLLFVVNLSLSQALNTNWITSWSWEPRLYGCLRYTSLPWKFWAMTSKTSKKLMEVSAAYRTSRTWYRRLELEVRDSAALTAIRLHDSGKKSFATSKFPRMRELPTFMHCNPVKGLWLLTWHLL